MNSNDLRFQSDKTVQNLKSVNGITVNRVNGSESSIQKIVQQFNPEVESMEGAAVAYVCSKMNVKWVQFRSSVTIRLNLEIEMLGIFHWLSKTFIRKYWFIWNN